ncbi:unnamed protein product [Onchocerca flexuosa]|uniref:Uncharacterized protein n=1 Tax=Onchocerca flexuosa TaxID=387005 RepID=A0A183H779_9BILA|nr:unnamed protein product [Onchocerca flexuosa]
MILNSLICYLFELLRLYYFYILPYSNTKNSNTIEYHIPRNQENTIDCHVGDDIDNNDENFDDAKAENNFASKNSASELANKKGDSFNS